MLPPLHLELLHSSAGGPFGDLVALYTEAFPAAERKPLHELHRMLARPAYRFFLARQGARLAGFAIVLSLSTGKGALLEYLAVDAALRNAGVGRWLLSQVLDTVVTQGQRLLFVEVESEHLDTPGNHRRARLKRFYRTLGAQAIVGLRWLMPPVTAETPPPMDLLVFGSVPASIRREALHRWLASLYVEVYGQTPGDPRLELMLAPLPAEIPVR